MDSVVALINILWKGIKFFKGRKLVFLRPFKKNIDLLKSKIVFAYNHSKDGRLWLSLYSIQK